MKKIKLITIAGLSLFTLALGALTINSQVFAVDTVNGQALEIAPPVLNLTANPGDVIEANISLRNVSSGKLIVSSELNDFVANGDDGTPKIILDQNETSPYSFKDWTGAIDDLALDAKQLATLKVKISVPVSAAPGGYYGIVRFTATPPELKGTGVSLSASLGSLILLKVNGDAKENMLIESFTVSSDKKDGWLFESTPIDFSVLLKNDGNVHEQPVGQITITDMFDKKIANVNVNVPIRNVLPSSTRKFEHSLDKGVLGSKILFGKYKADLKITYGTDKTVLTKTIEFWIIPYKLIGAFIITLIIIFLLLRTSLKKYNAHIIKQSQRQPKSKR